MPLRIIATALSLSALMLGTAQAYDVPAERPVATPMLTGLESVAESYWAARGITLPGAVEVFAIPEGGPEGLGESPGNRVWISEGILRWLKGSSEIDPGLERERLCRIYLHERGHNAGLTHTSPFAIMRPEITASPPRCILWASSF